MVFVAYITSGRDKYDYFTELVGVFHKKEDAEKAMKRNLIECGKIFMTFYDIIIDDKNTNIFDIENDYYTLDKIPKRKTVTNLFYTENDYYSILKKINNFEERFNKCNYEDQFLEEFKEDFINLDVDLGKIVNQYNDSFYEDGWEYVIDEVEIK